MCKETQAHLFHGVSMFALQGSLTHSAPTNRVAKTEQKWKLRGVPKEHKEPAKEHFKAHFNIFSTRRFLTTFSHNRIRAYLHWMQRVLNPPWQGWIGWVKQPLRKAARDVKGRHSTNWRSCSVSTVSLLLPFTSFLFHHLPCPEPDGLLNGNRATKPALQNPLSSEQHRNILR